MPAAYNENVFINCPFDPEYAPNLQAIVFTVYRCGFLPLSALSEDNGLQNRLSKIEKLVETCRYGIHDISRTESSSAGLPRFNMPFELGIFFGAQRFGNKSQKIKNALIFERTRFSYQQYLSDLNGVDIKAHKNDPDIIIQSIRDWLKTSSQSSAIPGQLIIKQNFKDFRSKLPSILSEAGLEQETLAFNDLCLIVEETLKPIMKT